MSALSQIAKDPSCILAVDALQGGRWLSPLRPGTQRNFAVAIKTWDVNTDPAVLALLDGIEDWQFEMVCHGIEAGKAIWRSSVTETANCFLMLFSDSTSIWARIYDRSELVISSKRVALLADVTADSRIKVTARREGTTYTLTATVDGVQTLNVTQDHTLTATAGTYATPRTATGYVDSIRITNLTMQEVVWQAAYSDLYDTSKPWPSAPSGEGTWEERTGLLTLTNINSSGGVFRAADSSARWNVKTPLRWQNLTTATIMVRATLGDFPETVFSFGLPANPNYAVILLRRSAENQLYASLLGKRADGSSVYRTMTADFSFVSGKKDTFAFVFDINGDFMRLYANGELLASAAVRPLVAIATNGTTVPGFMLGTTSFSDAVNSGSSVSAALVFDRALTAAEIAALSYAVV